MAWMALETTELHTGVGVCLDMIPESSSLQWICSLLPSHCLDDRSLLINVRPLGDKDLGTI
jgi:hypothetical protein